MESTRTVLSVQLHAGRGYQGGVKVILEWSNKNCDHCSHIREVQLRKVSRLKLRVYYT